MEFDLEFQFEQLKRILNNTTKINKDNIDYYIEAIDLGNVERIKYQSAKDKHKHSSIDIVYEIFQRNRLDEDRLIFIIENCQNYLNISTKLIKILINYSQIQLLDAIFNNYKFFDNEFIKNLLYFYKYKNPISTMKLNQLFKKYEFKSFVEESKFNISKFSLIKYLFAACKFGSIYALKYFISLGIDINGINHFGETTLHYACKLENMDIVRYLVKHDANINIEKKEW
ncbi:hypothetical protein H8356DRAFT_279471 [Neocallimastix lanati (nom. inval.)]|nr:hypothetical protein H8356DRAFT_279471 [Neocallimastix sp. JGI-2020a]